MARKNLFLVLALFAAFFPEARAEWVPMNGPEGGQIHQIVVAPGSPQTAYAATGSGLFKTTDSGIHWVVTGPGDEIRSVAVDPFNPETVYAAAMYAGLWKTVDGGDHWTPLEGIYYAFFLATHPAQPDTLFALTWDAILRSTDGGASWTTVHYEGMNAIEFLTLSISPVPPYHAYATTYGDGIFGSTDGGEHWARVNSPSSYPQSLAVDPAEPTTVYAGLFGRIYRSTNAGQVWTAYLLKSDARDVFDLLTVENVPGLMYAATDWGVYKSLDYGQHWQLATVGLPPRIEPCKLAASPDGQVLYVGSYGLGVYRSTDGGAEWSQANAGLRALAVQAVLDNGKDGLYVGTRYGGVYRTTDNGAHWTEMNKGLNRDLMRYFGRDVRSLASDPVDRLILYAGTFEGLFKSTDGGENWSFSGDGMPALAEVTVIVIDPRDSRIIYAGSEGGLYKTTDAGATWTVLQHPNGGPVGRVTALAMSPAPPHEVFLGESGTLFKSADGGTTWQFALAFNNYSMAIDPRSPNVIYSGGERSVQKSTDGGQTWINIPVQGLSDQTWFDGLAIDPADSNRLYAAMPRHEGIYRSTDGGMTWAHFNAGLRNVHFCTVAAGRRQIYAGTANGLYVLKAERHRFRRPLPSGHGMKE